MPRWGIIHPGTITSTTKRRQAEQTVPIMMENYKYNGITLFDIWSEKFTFLSYKILIRYFTDTENIVISTL